MTPRQAWDVFDVSGRWVYTAWTASDAWAFANFMMIRRGSVQRSLWS